MNSSNPNQPPLVQSEEVLSKELEFRKKCYRSIKVIIWNDTFLDLSFTTFKVVGDLFGSRSTGVPPNSALALQIGHDSFFCNCAIDVALARPDAAVESSMSDSKDESASSISGSGKQRHVASAFSCWFKLDLSLSYTFTMDFHCSNSSYKIIKSQEEDEAFDQKRDVCVMFRICPMVNSLFIMEDLMTSTQFHHNEILFLYAKYKAITKGRELMSTEDFITEYPSFTNSRIPSLLFKAFNFINEKSESAETLTFTAFIRGLSLILRGTSSDKSIVIWKFFEEDDAILFDAFLPKLLDLTTSLTNFGVIEEGYEFQMNSFERITTSLFTISAPVVKPSISEQIFEGFTLLEDSCATKGGENCQDLQLSHPAHATHMQQHGHVHHLHNNSNHATSSTSSGNLAKFVVSSFATSSDGSATSGGGSAFADRRKNIALAGSDPSFYSKIEQSTFLAKVQEVPELLDFFGLFDFLYKIILQPIESQLEFTSCEEKAGWLEKDKGESLANHAVQFFSSKDKRWFVVRYGFMAYYHKPGPNEVPLNVLSLRHCEITRHHLDHSLLLDLYGQWKRKLYCRSAAELDLWMDILRVNNYSNTRYKSYAPLRKFQKAAWFVNGKDYFEALVPLIMSAKQRILISGWAFAPGLYLQRAPKRNRIDQMLLEKAQQGVKVYILVWAASQLGFNLQSSYVTKYMTNLHPNIICLSHPAIYPFYWSHHQKFVVIDEQVATVGGIDIAYGRYDDDRHRLFDDEAEAEQCFPGRDYINGNIVGETNGKSDDCIYERFWPRMPWHDIHMLCTGVSAVDVAANFIERWNFTVKGISGMPMLFPLADNSKQPVDQYLSRLPKSCTVHSNCDVQIVRSISDWALPIRFPENSIYQSYIGAIKASKHYIFIANQYFISSIDRSIPKNKLLDALYKRLRLAIRRRERFRLIVLLPVHPAGDIVSPTTLYMIKYSYKSVSRQSECLFATLQRDFPDVNLSDYVSFHCLRNYGSMGPNYYTEGIYVHSKLMIVDDNVVIIGSANINDRSMRGTRDTELCAVVEGKDMQPIQLNGREIRVSRFGHSLRMRLFSYYLGITPGDPDHIKLVDVLSDDFSTLWLDTSRTNSLLFEKVFKLMPSNIYDASLLWALKPGRVNPDIGKTNEYLLRIHLMDSNSTTTSQIYNQRRSSAPSEDDSDRSPLNTNTKVASSTTGTHPAATATISNSGSNVPLRDVQFHRRTNDHAIDIYDEQLEKEKLKRRELSISLGLGAHEFDSESKDSDASSSTEEEEELPISHSPPEHVPSRPFPHLPHGGGPPTGVGGRPLPLPQPPMRSVPTPPILAPSRPLPQTPQASPSIINLVDSYRDQGTAHLLEARQPSHPPSLPHRETSDKDLIEMRLRQLRLREESSSRPHGAMDLDGSISSSGAIARNSVDEDLRERKPGLDYRDRFLPTAITKMRPSAAMKTVAEGTQEERSVSSVVVVESTLADAREPDGRADDCQEPDAGNNIAHFLSENADESLCQKAHAQLVGSGAKDGAVVTAEEGALFPGRPLATRIQMILSDSVGEPQLDDLSLPSDFVLLDAVRGFLVDFPLNFLKDDHTNLSPSIGTAEFMVPRECFL